MPLGLNKQEELQIIAKRSVEFFNSQWYIILWSEKEQIS